MNLDPFLKGTDMKFQTAPGHIKRFFRRWIKASGSKMLPEVGLISVECANERTCDANGCITVQFEYPNK